MPPSHASVEAVLTGVVNELSVYDGDLTLVLDDYHHTKRIYTKLGMNNRRAANSRAHQLGLLTWAGR